MPVASHKSQIKAVNSASGYDVNTALVERIIGKILKKIGSGNLKSVEVLFVSDRDIRKLNKRFKARDRITDVLSFELGDTGSIAISLDTASRNAKTFGAPFHEEAVRYVIHGILHLFGYDDGTATRRRKMTAKEEMILRSLCANINLSKVLTRP